MVDEGILINTDTESLEHKINITEEKIYISLFNFVSYLEF